MNLPALHFFVPRLRRWAFDLGFSARAARRQRGVRMLMHHGIDGKFPASRFEEQLLWLKDTCTILPMGEVVTLLKNKKPLPDFAAVLTFDDGLRNNLTEAHPLLVKHQVPATFFVCPGLTGTGQWIWTYEMRERLKTLGTEQLATLASRVCGSPLDSINAFVSWMKKQPNAVRQQAVEQVRNTTAGFVPSPQQRRDYDLMSWDELQSLDHRLITLGSHTMSHPILTSLTEEEIEAELKDSKEALVSRGLMEADNALICYPDGANDERVLASARRHYAGACSTRKGLINGNSPLHALPRIGANSKIEDVSWRLWRPGA